MTRLYAATIFLSAFLLFLIQPLIANLILPWFGGSAAVWITCMLFFQVFLLLGYIYAHCLNQFVASKIQKIIHSILLLTSLIILPLALNPLWKPSGSHAEPTLLIIGLLMNSIGLPYFLLATTNPLMQAWYTEAKSRTLYRLFAISNFGSILALLSYPFLVEPFINTRDQTLIWSAGYGVFIMLCLFLTWRQKNIEAISEPSGIENIKISKPSYLIYFGWFVLALCPSILFLVITNYLTEDVAPVPFLWVLPLSLYLLSFIFCFNKESWYHRRIYVALLIAGLMFIGNLPTVGYGGPIVFIIPLFVAVLFSACMICHGELARLKPHTSYLTSFYLIISLGGAAGGIFVGLIAPYLFSSRYEFFIGLLMMMVILVWIVYKEWPELRRNIYGYVLILIILLSTLYAGLVITMAVLIIMRYTKWPSLRGSLLRYAFIGLVAICVQLIIKQYIDSIAHAHTILRNFYGVLKIEDIDQGMEAKRVMLHGKTLHGFQFLSKARQDWPTSYYNKHSGVGLTITEKNKAQTTQRVGIIGLGTGTLAAYGRADDYYRIYEINPLVINLAKTEFTYLKNSKAKIDIIPGDARLSMEKEPSQLFDVLVLDAFSGNAIPKHLLTLEAFALYFQHLKPTGILAIHVSNTYVDLAPIAKLAADHYKKEASLIKSGTNIEKGMAYARWVLISESDVLSVSTLRQLSEPIKSKADIQAWTDDHSNLFKILRYLH